MTAASATPPMTVGQYEEIWGRSRQELYEHPASPFVARFLGRRLAYTYEFTDLVPNELLVMRTAEGPFAMETTYTWEPSGDSGTRMTLRNRGEPSGFSKVGAPLMTAAMRRANRKDLAQLKAVLESAP